MSRRFYVESPIQGEVAELRTTEAHHALKVMRCQVGDEVTLFDDSGAEFPAKISRIDRATVQLCVLERRPVDRELSCLLTIGVALPKGDRQRWLIEKTVELGVARLVPLVTERGVAQPGDKALDRLRRGVVEASKQCGRNRLMRIAEPMTVAAFCKSVQSASLRLLATPDGQSWPTSIVDATEIASCIGPEGGFTEDERNGALADQWTPIALGRRILRIETAAVAVASAVSLMTDYESVK
jgi:16S rRNA (uracil1498-N3)-methyltransferase